MAGNYYPPFSLRVSEELLEKIKAVDWSIVEETTMETAGTKIDFSV